VVGSGWTAAGRSPERGRKGSGARWIRGLKRWELQELAVTKEVAVRAAFTTFKL